LLSSLLKSTKSVGLYSITEDFFSKMLIVYSVKTANLLKLENNWFIKSEKEITGDIVQGLQELKKF
jgi:hypothetical protein